MQPQPMYKAYLVLGMRNVGTPFPIVVSADIYSSSAANLTYNPAMGDFYVDVMNVTGSSYQEASDKLKHLIDTQDWLSWARPWVDDSVEAHQARYFWRVKCSPLLRPR